MDATLCREHLRRLLQEEAAALDKLEALLDTEHGYIISDDIESLENTGTERDSCIGTLMQIDAERRSLCRATGRAGDKADLVSLITWCDAQGSLQQQWQANANRIRHTRNLNDRNGALVNNRLKRVEGLLDSLNGSQARNEKTYTARGNAYQQNQAGRVCNMEA